MTMADVLAGAHAQVRHHVSDHHHHRLLTTAMLGLRDHTDDHTALLPFVHVPLQIYAGLRGDTAAAYPLAMATTLLFLGIDILDDLADGDLPPHWQPHAASEIQLAACTLMCSLPQLILSEMAISAQTKATMLQQLSQTLLKMASGQLQDVTAAGSHTITVDQVEHSVSQKSGEECALFATLAAHLAGAPETIVATCAEFGRELGTAGQLASDCHDLFEADHSKDLANGSRTLPLALHLNRLPENERPAFLALLHDARTQHASRQKICQDLRANGILRLCAFIVELHCQRARAALAKLILLAPANDQLNKMINHVSFFSTKEVL